jgi:hypothetical protein
MSFVLNAVERLPGDDVVDQATDTVRKQIDDVLRDTLKERAGSLSNFISSPTCFIASLASIVISIGAKLTLLIILTPY